MNFGVYLLGYWEFLSFSFSANGQNVLKCFFSEVALISWGIGVLVGLSLFYGIPVRFSGDEWEKLSLHLQIA